MDRCLNCMQETTSDLCPYCGYDRSAYELQPGALKPPTHLKSRYYIGRVLGRGGFGITYNGWDSQNGRMVAIKEYFPSGLVARLLDGNTISAVSSANTHAYKSGVVKFFDEAQILSEFRGEKEIVEIYDFFYENETSYIVMEYVEGENILQMMASRNRMDTGTAVGIILKLIDTMIKVHTRDVLHRDISPSNIIVTEDGGIKLIDFGSARQFALDQQNSMSIILKNGFAPIEQYSRKGNHGPWTDIYSICATFYYMITGKLPEQATDRLIEDTLILPTELYADITSKQEAVLLKGLAVKSGDRYQSASELKSAIEEAYGKNRVGAPHVLKEEQMTVSLEDAPVHKEKHIRFIPVLITIISMAIIIVTMLSLTIWRKPPDGPIQTNVYTTVEEETEIQTDTIESTAKQTETERIAVAEIEKNEPAGTEPAVISVTDIKLNKPALTLEKGGTSILDVTINPTDASDNTVIWSTSSANVAVVSDGKVTAGSAGTAVITATTSNGKTVSCTVTVKPGVINAESVSLNAKTYEIQKGSILTLTATVYPSDTTDKTVTWTSGNLNVATVNAGGKVTAKSAGTAVITATTSNRKTATCTVTVTAVAVEKVNIEQTSVTLNSGEKATLSATVSPANAEDKTVTVTSSDPNVAVANGLIITAKNTGTATITVSTSNGKTATCIVTVKAIEVSAVNLEQSKISFNSGETTTLAITVSPGNAANTKVTLKSSDSSIVTVNGFTITAKNAGTATITATSSNGKTDTCLVTVKAIQATGISLSNNSLSITFGEKVTLTATILPSNTTNKNITWISDNIIAVTVSDKGNINAISEGTATITAKTSNGISATCTVIVTRKITAEGTFSVNAVWTLYNDGELIINGKGNMGNYDNYNSLYTPWYKYTNNIKTVTINGEFSNIGNGAFYGCSNLTNITIPNSVTYIGATAFTDCKSLTNIKIPSSVTYIIGYTFVGCDNLKSINVDTDNMYYSNDEYGILYDKNKTTLIRYPAGNTLLNLSIPNSVNNIENSAFEGCYNLTDIIIPNTVTRIGYAAFYGCKKLTNITIPNSVVNISARIFAFCDKLTIIYIEGKSSAPSSWDSSWYNDCNAVIKWNP